MSKFSQYPEKSSAGSGDFVLITDVSDTSSSPSGTTKKLQVQNIAPGLAAVNASISGLGSSITTNATNIATAQTTATNAATAASTAQTTANTAVSNAATAQAGVNSNATALTALNSTVSAHTTQLATVNAGFIRFPTAARTINGLGDSITAGSNQWQNSVLPSYATAQIPAWQPSTAYTVGQCVSNGTGGYYYRCTVAGTSASSGGPSGTTTVTDGGVTWAYLTPTSLKSANSFLMWVEAFSNGAVKFDQNQGYTGLTNGLTKGFVVNGGSGYTAPTISMGGGMSATLQVTGGVITGVTITNPGLPSTYPVPYTITDSSGSGAVLSFAAVPTGTFGTTGNRMQDILAMLPDAIASTIDIFTVLGGTNNVTDITSASTAAATITAVTSGLKSIYEGLMNAGKAVIAITILPRYNTGPFQLGAIMTINRWIRDYCRGEPRANPGGYRNIILADPTGFLTDGTKGYLANAQSGNQPIGGIGGVAGAVTRDGLHPNPKGAQLIAIAVLNALQKYTGVLQQYSPHAYAMGDGYNREQNPGGNMLEGLPWNPSTFYGTVGNLCQLNGNVYRLTIGGTSGTTGPSGTSTSTDGSCTWAYVRPNGISVGASGTAGTNTAATGITFTGSLATGMQLLRTGGSASGTITESIESPWSNNQPGQRQVLNFSLGTGTNAEQWKLLYANGGIATFGVDSGLLGTEYFVWELDVEITAALNLQYIGAIFQETNSRLSAQAGVGASGTGFTMLADTGEVMARPLSGRHLLTTQPMILPAGSSSMNCGLLMGFDASGAAGSATATLKINNACLRRAYV